MNDLLKIIIKCVEKSAVIRPGNGQKLVDADLFLEALKSEMKAPMRKHEEISPAPVDHDTTCPVFHDPANGICDC